MSNNNKKSIIDDFLTEQNGIFYLSDFNRKLLYKSNKDIKPLYKKDDNKIKDIIKLIKEHNLFSKIQKENKLMKQEIKKDYESLKEFKKKYYLKMPNENTYEGYSKIYYKFNKERSIKNNIDTNKLIALNGAGEKGLENIDYKEKINYMNKMKLNNILLKNMFIRLCIKKSYI
jgi:hypothetical protein